MGHKETLGGERLGTGNKRQVELHNYNRSTHDLGYVFRSTMASGTLVPFMSEIALRGDSFDIDLNAKILTHPTIGPLFGSYKVQLDVFQVPIRLYMKELHNNKLKIGMNMGDVYLPQMELNANIPNADSDIDNQQVNPSCILSYFNIRGLGGITEGYEGDYVTRRFNAIPWLAYWDIYKNYYANKSEEIGYVIHNNYQADRPDVDTIKVSSIGGSHGDLTESDVAPTTPISVPNYFGPINLTIVLNVYEEFDISRLKVWVNGNFYAVNDIFSNCIFDGVDRLNCSMPKFVNGEPWNTLGPNNFGTYYFDDTVDNSANMEPRLVEFPLDNIDAMREKLLETSCVGAPVVLSGANTESPYSYIFDAEEIEGKKFYSITSNQEGLGIKTYQSDLFNNWMNTEWLDGVDGINQLTAIDTSNDSVTVNEIILQKKIYDMLNRIAVSGGSYNDYLNAVYEYEGHMVIESPMYLGGLSKELVFDEVVSTATSTSGSEQQSLGTLAGRGVMADKHKGGSIKVKVKEPSYIIGIVSLTPRIDYSQGNKWDMNLYSMDDLHKPALDEIGFQDLITDQMHWADSRVNTSGKALFRSAGKIPAWTNYMTNVNVVRGNFAKKDEQMFMVLNRRYDVDVYKGKTRIKDLTTYVDPSKFNHIFAETRRDAQNFWCQIKIDNIARRLMSAKVMPNL